MSVTIIIPVDFGRRSKDLYKKISHLLFGLKDIFPIVIGYNNRDKNVDVKFKKLIQQFNNLKVAELKTSAINLALFRNTALMQATSEYVLFLDADIYPAPHLIELLLLEARTSKHHISMAPCLYLTHKGSQMLYKKDSSQRMIEYYFAHRRDLIAHLAFPSSIICVPTKLAKKIMFDEHYSNHGYEDFDFMIRLFTEASLISSSSELLLDRPYNSLMLMQGFRKVLAEPFMHALISKHYALHMNHRKSKNEEYYIERGNNMYIYQEKLRNFKTSPNKTTSSGPCFGHSFFKYCETNQINVDSYAAFFDPMPGHMWRCKSLIDYLKTKLVNIYRFLSWKQS